jgi:hypothetical protein
MSPAPAPGVNPLVVRILQVSAMLMFVFSLLAFNDKLPFDTTPGARKILGPALFFAGFLDLVMSTVLSRRAR